MFHEQQTERKNMHKVVSIEEKKLPGMTMVVETLASNLRKIRRSRGMIQADLAKAIGVSFQQIGKYERGTNIMSAVRILQVAIILGVSINDFYNEDYLPPNTSQQAVSGIINQPHEVAA